MEATTKLNNENLLFIGFNQDCECFMVGLEDGYRIYNTDPLKENAREGLCTYNDDDTISSFSCFNHYITEAGSVKHVEMLYRCNYVGIVGGGSNPIYPKNKAIVWDDYQKKVAISLEFNTEVLAIKLRRDRIAVVFEKLLKVYTFSQTPQLLHVFETYSNPSGFCCLCSHSTNASLAYLGRKCGTVILIDLANTEKPPIEIMAHETAISCMTMSNDGSKVATSSTKGTLIRVFDTDNGVLLHELRRGANHANIFCINFNKTASRLCVSSDHGTIHVFVLDVPEKNSRSTLANATFLPKYFQSKWSCFKFEVNNNTKSICAFSSEQQAIIAICADGTYYKYSMDNGSVSGGGGGGGNSAGRACQLESCTKFLELSSR